jgi:hypothetical protein
MKQVVLLFCLFVFSASCKKDTSNSRGEINGTWELRGVEGGFRDPSVTIDVSPGNGTTWSFRDTTFEYRNAGQLSRAGSFTKSRDSSAATGRVMNVLVFSNNDNDKVFFEISGDSLTMYRGTIAADGTIERYVRIKDTASH